MRIPRARTHRTCWWLALAQLACDGGGSAQGGPDPLPATDAHADAPASKPDGNVPGDAASSVFRHAGLEAALNQSFTPQSAASVKIDASDLNADIHASAAYRANLISVQTQRAVQQMLG